MYINKFTCCMFSLILFITYLLAVTSYASPKSIEVVLAEPVTIEIISPKQKISDPSLSPNNKIMAFVDFSRAKQAPSEDSFNYPAEGMLWGIDAAKKNEISQLSKKIILKNEPAVSWSPASNAIAFGTKGEIWITYIDDNREGVLLPKPNNERIITYPGYYEDYFHSPSWSPNGDDIAMANVYDVWLYDIKFKTYSKLYSPPEELRPGKELLLLPSINWSHDSQKLTFILHKIVLLPSQSKPSNSQKLTFLQDKTKLPFDSIRKMSIEGLVLIDKASMKSTQIIGSRENIEYYPVFSPDDKLITFLSRKDFKHNPSIFIYDIAHNKSRWVADCKDECHMLSWSKDGTKLYFASNKAIWVLNFNKPTQRIEKKIAIKGMANLSNVYWFPRGDIWFFLKPLETDKYLFGSLSLTETR